MSNNTKYSNFQSKHFKHLKDITYAYIDGEQVDTVVVKDPRRLRCYVSTNCKGPTFVIRIVEMVGSTRISRSGSYILEGVKFPKFLYIPSRVEGLNRENILRTPEKIVNLKKISPNGHDIYRANAPRRRGFWH